MTQIIRLTTTCSSQQHARELASQLLTARLAACVQISGPVESHYRWEGQLHHDPEWICTAKSTCSLQERLIDFVQTHHQYQLPQIVIDQLEASPAYAAWVEREVEAPPTPGT